MTSVIISASLPATLLMKKQKAADGTVAQGIWLIVCKQAVQRGRSGMVSRAWRRVDLTFTLFWASPWRVNIYLLHISFIFPLGWEKFHKQNSKILTSRDVILGAEEPSLQNTHGLMSLASRLAAFPKTQFCRKNRECAQIMRRTADQNRERQIVECDLVPQ